VGVKGGLEGDGGWRRGRGGGRRGIGCGKWGGLRIGRKKSPVVREDEGVGLPLIAHVVWQKGASRRQPRGGGQLRYAPSEGCPGGIAPSFADIIEAERM